MAKTLLLIVNPKAGKRRSRSFFFDVISIFSEAGYLVNLRQTRGPGDAVRLAQEEGRQFDLVVCYGGDGTLNQTVNGLMGLPTPPPVGYIAGGSTNDFAASLRLPGDPAETARLIVSSPGRRLDVGRFNDRHFIYVASFGAFTKASYAAPQNIKNDLGHLAYIIEGVKDLPTLRYYRAHIEADGEVFDGRFLFGAVANATSIGGLLKLSHEDVVMDDGKFEMLLVPEPKSLSALNDMLRALILQEFDHSNTGLIMRHVSRISISTEETLPWSLDGEPSPAVSQAEILNLHQELLIQV